MDKTFKNIIIAGIIIISFLIGYFISNKKTEFDACYDKCISIEKNYPEKCLAVCKNNEK